MDQELLGLLKSYNKLYDEFNRVGQEKYNAYDELTRKLGDKYDIDGGRIQIDFGGKCEESVIGLHIFDSSKDPFMRNCVVCNPGNPGCSYTRNDGSPCCLKEGHEGDHKAEDDYWEPDFQRMRLEDEN